ncbi:hypothetical protein FA95DRAFT_1357611 [Auriscalpium vulgare]|uniref:Uncharacterized protein n=1 Tax=Auriscalpium vulgare TaxID=40419 RepID=A0ACB8R2J5_9AGAM|nr:hypothetical protein FA95DRAFT_1357611 [Auriscalpium vulgare]
MTQVHVLTSSTRTQATPVDVAPSYLIPSSCRVQRPSRRLSRGAGLNVSVDTVKGKMSRLERRWPTSAPLCRPRDVVDFINTSATVARYECNDPGSPCNQDSTSRTQATRRPRLICKPTSARPQSTPSRETYMSHARATRPFLAAQTARTAHDPCSGNANYLETKGCSSDAGQRRLMLAAQTATWSPSQRRTVALARRHRALKGRAVLVQRGAQCSAADENQQDPNRHVEGNLPETWQGCSSDAGLCSQRRMLRQHVSDGRARLDITQAHLDLKLCESGSPMRFPFRGVGLG